MDLSTLSPLLPNSIGQTSGTGADLSQLQSTTGADFDSFLTLLTAQLRNQDPLSPLDSTEFVAQLASFSSVEQLVGVNERLDTLSGQALASDIASFSNWIGQDVVAASGVFRATGAPVSFGFAEPAAGQQIRATLRSADGRDVTAIPVLDPASGRATWSGLGADGNPITGTDLTIQIDYIEGGTPARTVPAEIQRRVTGIHGSANGLTLDLADGGTLAPDAVVKVQEPNQPGTSS